MSINNSPEEKLLSLIKGQKKPAAPQAMPLPLLREVPTEAPTHSPARRATFDNFSWPTMHTIIPVVFLAVCLFLIISFVSPLFATKNVTLPQLTKQEVARLTLPLEPEKKPVSFYQEAVQKRAIFSSLAAVETAKPIGIASGDFIKDITLVGIISGANPQAIVEDKKNQKTYYVNKGQSIGDVQVDDILEGKIILNYNGGKYEVYL